MARAALEQLPVEKVVFIQTGMPPYRDPPVASVAHRLAMLRLATQDNPRFTIDERELAPRATGYMADTLRTMHRDLPDRKFFLLMGADQFNKLDTWERPHEVRSLSDIAVFSRPGFSIAAKARIIPFDQLHDSATEIRKRVAAGKDIAGMVPPPVASYIAQHGLYR
jgi:nicotinate-nucleotide adenylyltransferase